MQLAVTMTTGLRRAGEQLAVFAERVRLASGWRAWLLSFLAGCLAVLALAPYFAIPVLFVSFSLLVWLLDGTARPSDAQQSRSVAIRRAAAIGWWFGFGYFLAGLYWIANSFLVEADKFAWLIPFAIAALPAGLALFFAAGCAGTVWFWARSPAPLPARPFTRPFARPGARLIVLAIALSASEWLRGHILTGFPWSLIGHSLTGTDYLIGSAAIFGVNGLTFWAVLLFAAPAALHGRWRLSVPLGITAWLLLVQVILAPISATQAASAAADSPPARLRLVQPNIPQALKWLPEQRRAHFDKLLNLSRSGSSTPAAAAPEQAAGITHIIWPETAVPFLLLDTQEGLDMIGAMLVSGQFLITGAHRLQGEFDSPTRKVFNSIVALDESARPVAIYDKHHLVPFGEYLPFQQLLESIGFEQLTRMKGGFDSGVGAAALQIGGLPIFSPLICYEIIFSGNIATVRNSSQKPEFLLNLTNDAWFGATAGPYQHLLQSRVRAVEEGLPVIRVANTGMSAVIAADGGIVELLELDREGIIDAQIPPARVWTPYARLGDWILLFHLLIGVLSVCFLFNTGNKNSLPNI